MHLERTSGNFIDLFYQSFLIPVSRDRAIALREQFFFAGIINSASYQKRGTGAKRMIEPLPADRGSVEPQKGL